MHLGYPFERSKGFDYDNHSDLYLNVIKKGNIWIDSPYTEKYM